MSENLNQPSSESSDSLRVADRTNKKVFFRKRKGCPLHTSEVVEITYKNPELLKRFTSEGGRILASRITGICTKHQREIARQIKVARMIALMPFVTKFD
jgi:small subunit ribosomal protein S18